MTAILGWHDGERGWIASDRRHSANNSEICSDTASKIVEAGDWLIGLSGASIGMQILAAHRDSLAKAESPHALCRALRDAFIAEGYPPVAETPGSPPCVDTSFIAIHPEHKSLIIFRAFSYTLQDRTCQLGSGGPAAQGAFEALRRYEDTKTALIKAIQIACFFDSACGGDPEVRMTRLRYP